MNPIPPAKPRPLTSTPTGLFFKGCAVVAWAGMLGCGWLSYQVGLPELSTLSVLPEEEYPKLVFPGWVVGLAAGGLLLWWLGAVLDYLAAILTTLRKRGPANPI